MIQYEEKKRVAAESAAASTSTEGTVPYSFNIPVPTPRRAKTKNQSKNQWSIQSLCLYALSGIVEGTRTATNDESFSIHCHQRDQFLGTTMKSFLLATEMITAHSTSDSDKY